MEANNALKSPRDSGETHDISIDIIEFITKKLPQSSNPSLGPTSCIFRVPNRIRQANPDAYAPDRVSIGPYHRGKDNLHAMEEQKLEYVKALLDRTEGRTNLQVYVEALMGLKDQALGFYSDPIKLSDKEFVKMMLIDGLFLIELFWKFQDPSPDNDLIFHSRNLIEPKEKYIFHSRIMRDLVLVENQIPMSVLQKLFDLSMGANCGYSLVKMALSFFHELMPKDAVHNTTNTHKHLVDLVYPYQDPPQTLLMPEPCALGSSSPDNMGSSSPHKRLSLPCVEDLRRSGVKFNKADLRRSGVEFNKADLRRSGVEFDKTSDSYKEMKFKNGLFEIPRICIGDHTDTYLRNLIAYEQFGFQGTPYITSYAILMDNLINHIQDVEFLRGREIIVNELGDDYKVATLFNKLSTGISSIGFCHGKLCKNVDKYYVNPWNNWKATFKRNYCSSPWSCIAVFAGTLGLILAAWGVVVSTMSFFDLSFLNIGYRSLI